MIIQTGKFCIWALWLWSVSAQGFDSIDALGQPTTIVQPATVMIDIRTCNQSFTGGVIVVQLENLDSQTSQLFTVSAASSQVFVPINSPVWNAHYQLKLSYQLDTWVSATVQFQLTAIIQDIGGMWLC